MRPYEKWLPAARTLAITGICKNAGKTTLLNNILSLYPEFSWAVLSTGIDGEETDTVFKHPKPRVKLAKSTLFICDTKTLDRHQGDISVIIKLPHPSRPLWIARTMTDLETEITGPATVKEQNQAIHSLLRLGAQKVLVDGSLDRKSISHSPIIDAMILAVGASFGTMDEILNELDRIRLLSQITGFEPIFRFEECSTHNPETILIKAKRGWTNTGLPTVIGNETKLKQLLETKPPRIMIPGALSSKSYALLKSSLNELRMGLIVHHPDNLKLDFKELQELLKNTPVQAKQPFVIKGLALNSWAAGAKPQDADSFRAKIRSRFPDWDVLDIMEPA